MSTEKPWKRREAEAGNKLCPSCAGRGWCFFCDGTGERPESGGKRCFSCHGKGVCPVCEGDGQLPEEVIDAIEPSASSRRE